MNNRSASSLTGIIIFVAIAALSLARGDNEMVWYRLKHSARKAFLGKHTSERMWQEEVRQKSIDSFKNNPNRAEFLKANPGFLEANPHLR